MTFQGVPLQAYPTLEQLEALERALCSFERRHRVRVTFSTVSSPVREGQARGFRLDVSGWSLAPDHRSLEELTDLLEEHGVATLDQARREPAGRARETAQTHSAATGRARWKLSLPRLWRVGATT
ncbi:hypothetical protein [Deinococcus peraridilitoris]|uniref:Uncharacterized protein n=1 Tax=Deinococcus peraridilitoris (strain DSM 19664 / LMG 22246 / CIP 109416 / KR-200) TaxID=937777 RepID=K9ZY77_DEIPD|nr:hypothetical protein [Deinococcus peraridilitoris]AFZ66593.1 hypothetical protein Deipe_1029 [Deinococcus peraridilitoris DSM 19664]